jgi:hypothetical protein
MGWEGGIAAMAVSVAVASCGNRGSAPTSFTGSTEEGQSCSEVGYSCNRTGITLQSPNDAWASGTYTLVLNIGGTPAQCSLPIPDPPPTNGVQGTCGQSSDISLSLVPLESCPPVVCEAGVCHGTSCTPIPGRFQIVLGINGTPAQLGLDLSLEGNELMKETIAPTQTTTEPNGAGCGTCTNASATLSIAGG